MLANWPRDEEKERSWVWSIYWVIKRGGAVRAAVIPPEYYMNPIAAVRPKIALLFGNLGPRTLETEFLCGTKIPPRFCSGPIAGVLGPKAPFPKNWKANCTLTRTYKIGCVSQGGGRMVVRGEQSNQKRNKKRQWRQNSIWCHIFAFSPITLRSLLARNSQLLKVL